MRSPWRGVGAAFLVALTLAPATASAAPPAERDLRAAWVGTWVVLRTEALSDCDERYTDNRMRGPLPASNGIHRFRPGELGRVDNLHLQRARIDLLVSLAEPLRTELRDGPFQLFEHRECRVELELPVARSAVRQSDRQTLEATIGAVAERHPDRAASERSALWNRRRVEPLPADHDQRWAAYEAWKREQLYLALRDRLAEALDRVADVLADLERGGAYAHGLAAGAREHGRGRLYSTACEELPAARYGARSGSPPEELEDDDARLWEEGFEDGQLLRFETSLARRIERCLP